MSNFFGSLQKTEDGLPGIHRSVVAMTTGVFKHLTRTEFDAAVLAERARISNNAGVGIYQPGERLYIIGEAEYRLWLYGAGSTDAQKAAASHARTVAFSGNRVITLPNDANTCTYYTGIPPNSMGVDGNVTVDGSLVYQRTAGVWAAAPGFSPTASGLPTPIPFTTAIDFSGNSAVAQVYMQIGPLNLTMNTATAVLGGGVLFSILASGAPITITGANPANQAAGNIVTAQGVVNDFSFIKTPSGYVYTVCQPGYVASTTVGPALSNIEVLDSAMGFVTRWTFAGALDASVTPPASAFAIAGHAVASVAAPVGSYVDVTHSVAFVYANTEVARTGTYTQPATSGLRNAAGLLSPTNTTPMTVTNSYGLTWSTLVNVRLDTTVNMTESGDATAGYTYTGTSAGVQGNITTGPRGGSTLPIPAGADFQFVWSPGVQAGGTSVTDAMVFLGDASFSNTATIATLGNPIYGVDINNNGTNISLATGSSANGTPNGGLTVPTTASASWKARLTRRLGKVVADLDLNDGQGWKVYHTFTDTQNTYGKTKALNLRTWMYVGATGSTLPGPIKGYAGPAQTLA